MMLEKFAMPKATFGGENQNHDENIPNDTIPHNIAEKTNPKDPDSHNPPKDKGKWKVGETSKKAAPSDREKRANPASQPPKKNKGTDALRQGHQIESRGRTAQKENYHARARESSAKKDKNDHENCTSRSDDVDEVHPISNEGSGNLSTSDLQA
uniref:Uncharacterized protein n=1 Tax=Cannabis sativa TaxID=3483 RepID=A0A803QII5_CANSA